MERLDYRKSEAWRAVAGLSRFTANCGLDLALLELVKLRASQINGCAYCVNMHVEILRKNGEPGERLQNLVVWQEATCFNNREKAAFAWAEFYHGQVAEPHGRASDQQADH